MRQFIALLCMSVLACGDTTPPPRAPTLVSSGVEPRATMVISDTSRAEWTPSPDNGTSVVTRYESKVYVSSLVVGGVEPTSPPTYTLDFGKPPVQNNVQQSPLLKPLVGPNVDYTMFLRAVGPGGQSTAVMSPPFGYPSVPRPAASTVTFTP